MNFLIISEITLMKWLAFITVKISRKLNLSEKILPKFMVLTYQCESNGENADDNTLCVWKHPVPVMSFKITGNGQGPQNSSNPECGHLSCGLVLQAINIILEELLSLSSLLP
jgi:hypothetical protein